MKPRTLPEEIKEFLTTRRSRLTPHQVGLTLDGGVRRVPGLRREEVATLAGISVEYYVLLERGNLSTASEQVLSGLVHALHLDDDERMYLHHLARASRRPTPHTPASTPPPRVSERVREILEGFHAGPAWVRNEYMDILATNDLAEALYEPIHRAIPERPNTARHLFLAPDAGEFWVDAEHYAAAFAAKLRLESATSPGDPRLESLVRELREHSGSFRSHWASAEVGLFRNGVKRFRHPRAGRLNLHYETMELNSAPGQILSFYLPQDAATAAGLAVLRGS